MGALGGSSARGGAARRRGTHNEVAEREQRNVHHRPRPRAARVHRGGRAVHRTPVNGTPLLPGGTHGLAGNMPDLARFRGGDHAPRERGREGDEGCRCGEVADEDKCPGERRGGCAGGCRRARRCSARCPNAPWIAQPIIFGTPDGSPGASASGHVNTGLSMIAPVPFGSHPWSFRIFAEKNATHALPGSVSHEAQEASHPMAQLIPEGPVLGRLKQQGSQGGRAADRGGVARNRPGRGRRRGGRRGGGGGGGGGAVREDEGVDRLPPVRAGPPPRRCLWGRRPPGCPLSRRLRPPPRRAVGEGRRRRGAAGGGGGDGAGGSWRP